MNFSASIIFAILVAGCYAEQQIHYLRTITKGVEYSFKYVQVGSAFYVASNDDIAYLNKITVRVDNITYTLDAFSNAMNGDGSQKPLAMTGNVVLSTTNEDVTTQSLTGFIYVTTAAQAIDPNFKVYVASSLRTVQSTNDVGVASTSVILNTNLNILGTTGFPPPKTAFVSNISQLKTSTFHILTGIPSSNGTSDNMKQTIFKNPLPSYTTMENGTVYQTAQFFDNIIPIHMDVDYWFIKATGTFSLTVEPTWDRSRHYKADAVTTTGLIVNEYIFQTTVVDLIVNYANTRTTGAVMTIDLDLNQNLTILYSDSFGRSIAENFYNNSKENQNMVSSDFQADKLTVTASIVPGKFYIQYFGIDGTPLPSTNAPISASTVSVASTVSTIGSTSPSTVWTTTKIATSSSTLFSSIIVVFVFRTVLS